MSNLLEEVRNIEEGFASDAQRRAAFASGYKEKGKKKKEETELDEAKYQVNYSKDGKLYSKIINAKNEDDAEEKAIKKFKIDDDDIRSVVKEETELDEMFDYVLLDKDNKIVGRYSGKNAKKEAESGKRSAHLPPMRIPKGEVSKMKVYPISPKDKKGIGDMVLAIGEEVELDESKMKQLVMYIDDIAREMAKDKMMKPFVSKFKADAMKSMNPRKSLEKVLPDYIAGKEIANLLNMGMGEEKLNEILPAVGLAVRAAPAVAKAVSKINPATIGNAAATVATGAQKAKDYISKKAKAVKKRITGEDVEVIEGYFPEAKSSSGYDLYHNDFSSAMQHAYDHAKKKFGITIDKDEIDDKVATGPRKPTKGKTNSYRLKGDKGAVRIQVYNMGNKFELNMYKEEVEIQEKFTMKDFKDNEDANNHTENGVELVNMYGTPAEKKLMAQIAKNHNRRGSIEKKEQELRDKLIKKYYLRLESVEEAIDPADVDISATDKDVENASKNIILQLRKVITLRGMKPVEFASGKEKVNPNIAQKALSIHQNLRRTDEKDAFQRKIAKSYKDLLNAVKGRK